MPESMTPEERAELIRRVGDLSQKLDVSEEQRKQTAALAAESKATADKASAHTKWLWVATVGLALVAGWLWTVADTANDAADDISDQAVTNCESGNLRLAGQRQIWEFYFEVTAAAGEAQDAPEAVLDFYREYLVWITDEVLPDRDCTNLDEPIKTPGPPPSYEQALKEALADEAARGD